jgi:NADP-dependent aldehyde dehydrogenase
LLQGTTPELSRSLVRHPFTRAVGFTGSQQAGRALFDAAAARSAPIPVFAEMGSINPVFVLPNALKARGAEIAQSLAKSVTVGVGQFCTKPGVVVGLSGANFDGFLQQFASAVGATPAGTMLHAGIAKHYSTAIAARAASAHVRLPVPIAPPSQAAATQAAAAVFVTEAQTFLQNTELRQEVFGPASLAVTCDSPGQLEKIAQSLEGQLTITVHGDDQDLRQHAALIATLREKCGRLVFGGVPTGVEVAPAMHHGGPYPATTDPRFTSVGTAAILRFVRPLCFQDCPEDLLPPELKNSNPLGIWRLVDNEWTRAPITLP